MHVFPPSVFGVSSTRVTPCLCTWFIISVSMLNSFAVCFSCFLFRRVYVSFIRFSTLTSVHGWFPSSCEHDNIPARNKFNQIFCSRFLISKYESWILSLSSSSSPTLSICVLVFFRSICTNIPFNLYKFASDLFLWGQFAVFWSSLSTSPWIRWRIAQSGDRQTPFPCHFVDSSHSSKSRTCKRELSLLAGSLSLSLGVDRAFHLSFSHVMDSVGLMRFDILVLFLLRTLFSPSFGPAQPPLYLKIHFLYFNCMKSLSVIFVPPSLVNSCSTFQFVLSSVSCLSAYCLTPHWNEGDLWHYILHRMMLENFYSTSAAYHVTLLRTFLETCHGCFKSNFLICHIGRDKGLVLKKRYGHIHVHVVYFTG